MNALCERKDRGVIRRRGLPGERQRAPDLGGPSRLALPRGPLFLEFTADPAAWEVEDQFLLGPDILVAPVTELGARQRRVYLPAGAEWTHIDTGRRYAGGGHVDIPAPLDRIPVLVRDDAQRPLKMEVQ